MREDTLVDGLKWRQKDLQDAADHSKLTCVLVSTSISSLLPRSLFSFIQGLPAGTGRKGTSRFFKIPSDPCCGDISESASLWLKVTALLPIKWSSMVRDEHWDILLEGALGRYTAKQKTSLQRHRDAKTGTTWLKNCYM